LPRARFAVVGTSALLAKTYNNDMSLRAQAAKQSPVNGGLLTCTERKYGVVAANAHLPLRSLQGSQ